MLDKLILKKTFELYNFSETLCHKGILKVYENIPIQPPQVDKVLSL